MTAVHFKDYKADNHTRRLLWWQSILKATKLTITRNDYYDDSPFQRLQNWQSHETTRLTCGPLRSLLFQRSFWPHRTLINFCFKHIFNQLSKLQPSDRNREFSNSHIQLHVSGSHKIIALAGIKPEVVYGARSGETRSRRKLLRDEKAVVRSEMKLISKSFPFCSI